jgi:hypothetical protein
MNDLLREVLGFLIRTIGFFLSWVQERRIRNFKVGGKGLKKPKRTDGRYALTSGSAGEPKRILYTSRRLRTVKFVFSDMFARACCAFRSRRSYWKRSIFPIT